MFSAFYIFLIAALLCVVMLLVLTPLLRSEIPGVKAWWSANVLACAAFVLYAFGRQLPPLIAYEAANAVYGVATAAMLIGFRRFFSRSVPYRTLVAGIVLLAGSIAYFHYEVDSFALRTVTVSVFQIVVGVAIALTVLRSRKARRSRYPYLFTRIMAIAVAVGHAVRAAIYVVHNNEMTSLLQPSAWNLLFISAGTMALPVLTMGAVMMVHDAMMMQAEHAANRDFLTGAWSRRGFFALAEKALLQSRRSGRALSLLIMDIDKFKDINDRFGHSAGDQVLVDVVARTIKAIREFDYVGRIGGEEFAVLLPETAGPDARAVAERVRTSMPVPTETSTTEPAADPIPEPTTKPEQQPAGVTGFTTSIGVATLREGESFQELVRRADAALYRAKQRGRNRVESEVSIVPV